MLVLPGAAGGKGTKHDLADFGRPGRLLDARRGARRPSRRGAGRRLMTRAVAVDAPTGWVNKVMTMLPKHRTWCPKPLKRDKKLPGARSLSFAGWHVREGLIPTRALRADPGGFQGPRARRRSRLLRMLGRSQVGALALPARQLLQQLASAALCAPACARCVPTMRPGPIASPRPSWCGGGAFDAPGPPFERRTASPFAPTRARRATSETFFWSAL